MEDLGARAERFGEGGGTHRHHHKFLDVDRVVGVCSAIDDVHHRHRQHAGAGTAQIAVEREAGHVGGGLGDGEADSEDGVGPESALVVGPVELEHGVIDGDLVGRIHAEDGVRDLAVHGIHGLEHGLAEIAALVAVPELQRFARAGRGTRWHGSAAGGTRGEADIDLDVGLPRLSRICRPRTLTISLSPITSHPAWPRSTPCRGRRRHGRNCVGGHRGMSRVVLVRRWHMSQIALVGRRCMSQIALVWSSTYVRNCVGATARASGGAANRLNHLDKNCDQHGFDPCAIR